MNFTTGWFEGVAITWTREILPVLRDDAQYLEIGSFEGRSVSFILDKVTRSTAICIDPFEGSDSHLAPRDMNAVKTRFLENTARFGDRLQLLDTRSSVALRKLDGNKFDFIYIDGDHSTASCLADLFCAWPLLAEGGVIAVDDYGWTDGPKRCPGESVDTFIAYTGVRHKLTDGQAFLYKD